MHRIYRFVHKKQPSSNWFVNEIKLLLDKRKIDHLSQGLKNTKDLFELRERNKKSTVYLLDNIIRLVLTVSLSKWTKFLLNNRANI